MKTISKIYILLAFSLFSNYSIAQLSVDSNGDIHFEGTSTSMIYDRSANSLIPSTNYYGSIGGLYNTFNSMRTKYLFVNGVPITSDSTLKENVREIENASEKIKNLNGKLFDYKKLKIYQRIKRIKIILVLWPRN